MTLLGRVGIHPQMRGSEANPCVTFTLATSVRFPAKNSVPGEDTMITKTDWHNIAVFKPLLRDSVYEHVLKGNRVLVQGRILYGSVEDRAGVIRSTTTIVAEDVIRFADGKSPASR